MYFLISGALFALFAIFHLARAIQGWPIQIAQWSVPIGASWVALVAAGALSIWAFSAYRKSQ